MVTIYIDNVPYKVKEGQNLLSACLSLGINLPYFCWHPALDAVGACRQCAVKVFRDESDTRGRVVMGCMTAATEGVRLSVKDNDATSFRSHITEWLMLNHPHDCPVCDEGGECHLQDMTLMSGHNYRRTRFHKRTHVNQNLGTFINHEMNRCIQCYRCVRFYRDYSGGRDFNVFAAHDSVYFGRYEEGTLESPFSGNLVEICPTGVFTDKTFKQHPVRKWDLETAPSVCAHCSLGCNTIGGARYGTLRRILNRYNGEVNRYFICDRGRFGYEYANGPERVRAAEIATNDGREKLPTSAEGARRAVDFTRAVLERSGKVLGIGSPSASLESNFALRNLVGVDKFSNGLPELDQRLARRAREILVTTPARISSLAEVELSDAVLVLGEDAVNTAPMLELSLRQSVRNAPGEIAEARLRLPAWDDRAVREAVQDRKGPLFVATPFPVSLDEIALKTFRGTPDDIVHLAGAIAHAIDPANAPEPWGIGESERILAETIAGTLRLAKKPLVVSGSSLKSLALLDATANIARALAGTGTDAGIFLVADEANTMGSALIDGSSLEEAARRVDAGEIDTLIVLENDLYRRMPAEIAKGLLSKVKHLIVLDYVHNETTAHAEVLIPAATIFESSGTLVNNEGRAQRFYEVLPPSDMIRASWKWLNLIGNPHFDGSLEWDSLDFMADTIARQLPVLAPITTIAPPARTGLKVGRESHRYSGRTAMVANLSVHEPKPPSDEDSPLAYSMEGTRSHVPPSLFARWWAPHWNSVQSLTRFQEEIGGPLKGGDPGVRIFGRSDAAPPQPVDGTGYYQESEEGLSADEGSLLLLPVHHLFGTERTSTLSAPAAGRIPQPYLGLSAADAKSAGAAEGDLVHLTIGGAPRPLRVRVVSGLVAGIALVPAGLPGEGFVPLPSRGKLEGILEKAGAPA